MNRNERLLQPIDPWTDHGVEIGALCRPVVPPSCKGVRYVDHLSTEELKVKYASDPNVDINSLVPVSHVWDHRGLSPQPAPGSWDYVVASHVIEHVPDMIGWLRELAVRLKPGGIVSLAIPDKRWTFDCRRELTSLSMLLEAHFEGWTRPSVRQCLDFHMEAVNSSHKADGVRLWQGQVSFDKTGRTADEFPFSAGEQGLREHARQIKAGTYIDSHCQTFTPGSFIRVLRELGALNMVDFEVASFSDTMEGDGEFFVVLKKLPEGLSPAERRRRVDLSLPTVLPPLMDGEILRLQREVQELRAALQRQQQWAHRLTSSLAWRILAGVRRALRSALGQLRNWPGRS